MSLDIAEANVNRNITLAGTSVAIFTFLLFFLYNRVSNLLPGHLSPILLRHHSYLVSYTRAGDKHFWKSRSLLAHRLQPAAAGAKLDSVHREPVGCWALCIGPLVFLPVAHLAPV